MNSDLGIIAPTTAVQEHPARFPAPSRHLSVKNGIVQVQPTSAVFKDGVLIFDLW